VLNKRGPLAPVETYKGSGMPPMTNHGKQCGLLQLKGAKSSIIVPWEEKKRKKKRKKMIKRKRKKKNKKEKKKTMLTRG
jgi:hypothetical protein